MARTKIGKGIEDDRSRSVSRSASRSQSKSPVPPSSRRSRRGATKRKHVVRGSSGVSTSRRVRRRRRVDDASSVSSLEASEFSNEGQEEEEEEEEEGQQQEQEEEMEGEEDEYQCTYYNIGEMFHAWVTGDKDLRRHRHKFLVYFSVKHALECPDVTDARKANPDQLAKESKGVGFVVLLMYSHACFLQPLRTYVLGTLTPGLQRCIISHL
jgi:hypothetical protein